MYTSENSTAVFAGTLYMFMS